MAGKDAVACTILVQVKHFLRRGRFKNVQVLHDELVFLSPANPQASLSLDRVTPLPNPLHYLRVEQVEYFFVIDLEEADEDAVVPRRIVCLHLLDPIEKLVYAALCQAEVLLADSWRGRSALTNIATFHRVGFAGACLTIRKDRSMIPLYER